MSYNSDPLLSKRNAGVDGDDDNSIDATEGQGCCILRLLNRCKGGNNSNKRDQTSYSKRGKRETYNLPDSNKRLIEKLQEQGSNEAIEYINRPYDIKTDQQRLIEAGHNGDNEITEDGIVIRLQQNENYISTTNEYSSPIKITHSSLKTDNSSTTVNDNKRIPDNIYKQNNNSELDIKTNLTDKNSLVDNALNNTTTKTNDKSVNKQEDKLCSNGEGSVEGIRSNVTVNPSSVDENIIRVSTDKQEVDVNQIYINGSNCKTQKENLVLSSGPEEHFEASGNLRATNSDKRIILKDLPRESLVNGERDSTEEIDYNVLKDITAQESVCLANNQEGDSNIKSANKNLNINLNGAGNRAGNNQNTSLGGVNICQRTSPEGSERVNDLSGEAKNNNNKEEEDKTGLGVKAEDMSYYSIVTDPLLYTQADLDEVVKAREDEWQSRQEELETKIKEEIAMRELLEEDHRVKMESLKKGNTDMKIVVSQYEKTIVELTEQSQNAPHVDEDTLSETVRVKEQLHQDLNTAEQNLVDAYKRIEKLKVAIESYKQNEDSLKTSLKDSQQKLMKSEERYNKLKQHASEKIDAANIEIERVRKQKEIDLAGLQAALKKAQNRVSNLEVEISQKTHENRELSQICDELIKKVSGE